MKKNKNYYITTAIPYASAIPHIGNVYEAILTDAIARYKRLEGYNVYFQTGTDEHGQKIMDKAKEKGISSKEYADNISLEIRKIFDSINISYDNFVKTTDEFHEKSVSNMFEYFLKNDDIYLGTYEGLYSKTEEAFVKEKDLIDGLLPSGEKPILMKEETYFFKLSKYQDRLIKHINENPDFIMPESRRNEMLQFLKEPLIDLSISRTSFDWGVKVLFDPKHVVYVWLDALSNYITGIGFDPYNEKQPEEFLNNWPCDVHILGKDISRFHAIYWPIFLMALNVELPKTVFAHPWVLMNQQKMSKSKGNIIYTQDLVNYLGVDPTRYYCLSEIPYKEDGNLTFELVIEKTNNDLVNTLGNLLNRTLGMLKKYNNQELKKGYSDDIDSKELLEYLENVYTITQGYMKEFKVGDALNSIMEIARKANKYIELTAPWTLFKEQNFEKLNAVLYNLFQSLYYLAILLQPFIPTTALQIIETLKIENKNFEDLKLNMVKEGNYPQSCILFERIDKEKLMDKIVLEKNEK